MDEWFSMMISAGGQLPALAAKELRDAGLVVIPGPVAAESPAVCRAYDAAMPRITDFTFAPAIERFVVKAKDHGRFHSACLRMPWIWSRRRRKIYTVT
jgi:hypothetical protein